MVWVHHKEVLMRKHGTILTRRFRRKSKGMLIEEFMAVPRTPTQARRLIDGLIIRDEPDMIHKGGRVDIKGRHVVCIQTKATRLSMGLLGQAILSPELIKHLKPASIRSVALCTEGDAVLEPLA